MGKRLEKKKLHPLLIAVIVLLLLALCLCAVVFGLWFSGKTAMSQPADGPELPVQQEQIESEDQDSDGTFVEYNGKRYQYNDDIINILLMGIDSYETASEAVGNTNQADAIILVSLDQKQNKMTLINLSRDIMCDIDLGDQNEEGSSLITAQLALAYAYGDEQRKSCELTCDTASNLMYGLPIHGYGAYHLGGIPALNDAVGGVTLTVIDDVGFSTRVEWLPRLTEGNTITLTGFEARHYLYMRDDGSLNANEGRMKRQKQYGLALISKVKETFLDDPTSIFTLYDAIDDYLLTDLSISKISYLATIAVSMDFSGDIYSLGGEYTLNEENNTAELHVDQQELQELMLDVFYTEVPQ